MTDRLWRILVLILVPALIVSACGGGDDDTTGAGDDGSGEAPTSEPEKSTSEPTEEPTEGPTPTPTAASGAVASIEDVQSATVKIASQGTFVDPEVGLQTNAAGVGTGFVIDPSGIVVTNNHVVTGAALLEVFVDGRDEPVNAQVLGVSECSDLAVIDLEGEGYPYLEFGPGDAIRTGLDVYAAGFPLVDEATIEDVDYTLTSGIISSTTANGESNWASVDSVLEHDARIRGGNSGGPLVDVDGRVVGVNYSGISEADQNFAIGIDEAVPIIDQLRGGTDVESLGINGQAILDTENALSGIWVASVESGSPAANAGIEPGDIVTRLESLVLATDGTMADYCDIIRTRGADAVYEVEVLRFESEEVLEGEINGATLEPSFSFAQEVEEPVGGGGGAPVTYDTYVSVSDDTGAITVDLPGEWSDVDGRPNEAYGPSLYAAPDLTGFLETWDTPGVILEISGEFGPDDIPTILAEASPSSACVSEAGPQTYEDPLYTGLFEVWSGCGGTETIVLTLAVSPEDGSSVIRGFVQVVGERDLDAADTILNTFVGVV